MITGVDLPFSFWTSLTLLVALAAYSWSCRSEAWGIPAMAVCGTVLVWYHGDAFYNDYDTYVSRFRPELLEGAWWQVIGFTASFAVLVQLVHYQVNPSSIGRRSKVSALLAGRDTLSKLQRLLAPGFRAAALIWMVVSLVALARTGFDWQGYFFPWLGHKSYPWARDRIGGGIDFLFSFVEYINIFCLAVFGIIAALSRSTRLRNSALGLVILSWPYILFDRSRNTMLAIVLPAVLCFIFLRLRRQPVLQLAVLLSAFVAVEAWMLHVLEKRSTASAIAAGNHVNGEFRHLGLNMYEELCWINTFLHDGSYRVNWGHRYIAEAVNPVPRTLWRNKPLIGIDYAIARGQLGGSAGRAGVHATISTGMIGQGVVNFGIWLGPLAAALLMSFWVAILARFDLQAERYGRLSLYVLGLVLTFNLGRDITLLVAYPLIFGYVIVRISEIKKSKTGRNRIPSRRAQMVLR